MSDFFKRKAAKGVPRPEVKIEEFGEYDFSKDNNFQTVLHRFHSTKFCLAQQKPRIEKMNFRNTNSPLLRSERSGEHPLWG